MQTLIWKNLSTVARQKALARPDMTDKQNIMDIVVRVFRDIKASGDEAVKNYMARFDTDHGPIRKIKPKDIQETTPLGKEDCAAIQQAIKNIRTFHQEESPKTNLIETTSGIFCWRETRAIEAAGLYIPGGSAPLVSTLLMLAIPAQIAGVKNVIVLTPPDQNKSLHPAIAEAACQLGISEIVLVGGIQAIAALTHGTESIPKADKICGPGNAYVTAAKTYASSLYGGPAIDMPAGPSEVLVIADKSAKAGFVAADLLAQAEHDPSAQVIMLTTDPALPKKVESEIQTQMSRLPRRDICEKALKNARLILVESLEEAATLSNKYAPEHLIIQTENPKSLLKSIHNAGSVFLGPFTPESLGDYASGTNHVLPTGGAARALSGITVGSFRKTITVQEASPEGLQKLAPTVTRLATMEGLEAHRQSVTIRLAGRQTT